MKVTAAVLFENNRTQSKVCFSRIGMPPTLASKPVVNELVGFHLGHRSLERAIKRLLALKSDTVNRITVHFSIDHDIFLSFSVATL